jgi:predicted kinase
MDEIVQAALGDVTEARPEFSVLGRGPRRLLVMSGLPYSGKSHLVAKIQECSVGRIVVVRSDEIRPFVAMRMGRAVPQYDAGEHERTFALGGALIRQSLRMNNPTIADATNLNERYRQWAYGPARELRAETVVAFVQVDVSVAIDRAMKRDKERYGSHADSSVYRNLKSELEPPERCSVPYMEVPSEGDIRPTCEKIANWLNGYSSTTLGLTRPVRKVEDG